MKDNNKIVMLPRDLLYPHPDNPRKDLGDLEELKESIREHGIMQNLTVVPDNEDGYKILIGHRRFAASEGILDDLPCVVAKGLSNREQVGIMLCENMQRTDLTYMEQAHGFQMMLDLGDTVKGISEKTGFSEATVKHRLEINKLDKKAIEEASEYFQPTITDYIKLEKVKDIKKRNEILKEVGSSRELEDEINSYIEEVEREASEKKYRELFNSLGWKESKEYFYTWGDEPKWKRIKGLESSISLRDPFAGEQIKAATVKITEPVYYRIGYSVEFAIKVPQKEKKKTKEQLMEAERKKREAAINDYRIEICDLYCRFIMDIPENRIKELSDTEYKDITSKLCKLMFDLSVSMKTPDAYYNIKTHYDLKAITAKFPELDLVQQLMIVIWEHLSSSYENKLVLWNFSKNMDALKAHQAFYEILHFFGFRLEKDHYLLHLIKGTSNLYTIKEVK